MNENSELSLEKLKIHERLVLLEKAIIDDKEDTHSFRYELKEMLQRQHAILFGDGDQKKGLIGRTSELETIRGIHSKAIWTVFTVFVGLIGKTLWDFFTRLGKTS